MYKETPQSTSPSISPIGRILKDKLNQSKKKHPQTNCRKENEKQL